MANPNPHSIQPDDPGKQPETRAAPQPNPAALDPFDIENLRLPQDFEAEAGAKKLLNTVPVRKPHKQEWIWVHPDPEYRLNLSCLELKEEREIYAVSPWVAREIQSEVSQRTLFTCQNASRVTFLWAVRLPGVGERTDTWSLSAREAAEHGMREQIRVTPNMSLGAYEIATSTFNPVGSEPKWPDKTMQELIRIAFKGGHLIDTFDHPVIRQLRGEL